MVHYQRRLRVRSSEDSDHDGQMDRWTVFASALELTLRIERDTMDRGFPDEFEYFDTTGGEAVLIRRERDVNGDRKIDIVSIYEKGRLVRREIADPSLLPGV